MDYRYNVKYSETFWNDIDGIDNYYRKHYKDPFLVDSLLDVVSVKTNILYQFPNAYPSFDSNIHLSRQYRYFNAKNYIVLYSINQNLNIVEVCRIFYSGMDLKNMYI